MQPTFNSAHGVGPGHAGVSVGVSHGLGMGDMNNGGVAMGGVFDQDLNFDESLLDSVNTLAPLPFGPSYDFDSFNTFEDPFAYSTRPVYDVPAENEPFNEQSPRQREEEEEEDQEEEIDNKLLGFSAPIFTARILDGTGSFAEATMTAELLGMFFVAEDVFGGENTGRPLELTCYRRNLWRCSGQITLPRHVSQMINEQGQRFPAFALAASISAKESIDGKPTEIISIPWKSSSDESTKSPAAPARVPLDLSTGQELDHNRICLPVSWKRLQFKHATANNGRRKGLQQHYVVQINLLCKRENGEFLKIAEIQSGPVIVRGRSPRNFDSRKDVSVSGDKKSERRATGSAAAPDTPMPVPKTEPGADLGQNLQRLNSLPEDSLQTPPASSYGLTSSHPAKKVALSPRPSRPPVPAWSSDRSMKSGASSVTPGPATPRTSTSQRPGHSSLPINLSLSEDEHSPNRSKSDSVSPHFSKSMAISLNAHLNVDDDEEEIYEYFPLSLDDWMPPVDAIYRPHVVHHTIIPPELKAQQVRSRTKRYFSSD
ncbi:unnamed protein product [Discula destructiva]